jgi:hypothetical protein
MTRSETIARLKDGAAAVQARGATSLYFFGSSARDGTACTRVFVTK